MWTPTDVYAFGCPYCGAKANARCVTKTGKKTWDYAHPDRRAMFELAVDMWAMTYLDTVSTGLAPEEGK